jgi:tRNA-specific 2-thiouridylase
VKYTALLSRARAVGFDALATGHHVRLRTDRAGRHHLLRAADPGKDQTYVLYMATQDQLAHTLWPVGEHTKDDLRDMAAERGLAVARKRDSSDICFIPSGDLGGFLRPRLGERPGRFIGPDGGQLGSHDGAFRFTVGQRRGLGLASAAPLYVTAIDGTDVHVGERSALETLALDAADCSWIAGAAPAPAAGLSAQVRSRGNALPAQVQMLDQDRVTVSFPAERPLGVAAGQAVVFYAGEECLGGATVQAARTTAQPVPVGAGTGVQR